MANYDSNYEIAQEISARIGNSPVPFDSVYSICLAIYQELGGTEETFDSVYSILLEILPLATEIGHVIDDNAISSGKTWSSSKINSELNGKQNTLAAGEGIIISGDTISATATGGDDAIEEVSELPEASENKDKLYRLDNGEKDVYAAKLLSSETITTNRLPDEQQIDKAYLYDTYNDFVCKYDGEWKVVCTNGELKLYGWIYSLLDDIAYLTLENAETITSSYHQIDFANWYDTYDAEHKIMNINDTTENVLDGMTQSGEWLIPIPATYNAPESAQIGNAYLLDDMEAYTGVYDGTQVTFTDTDGSGDEVTGYKWRIEGTTEYLATSKPASEIYYYYDSDNDVYYTDIQVWVVFPDSGNSERSTIQSGSGDKNIYIPQLNAPDSEQVGKASMNEIDTSAVYCYYTGIEKTIVLADRTFNVYLWGDDKEQPGDWYTTTLKPANQIYGESNLMAIGFDSFVGWIVDGNTVTNTSITYDEFANECIQSISDVGLGVHIIPYQRTEVVEDWEWKKVATEQYVDDAIDNIEFPEYVAGSNISISDDNEISCTYEVGYGLENDNQVIKIDDDAIKTLSDCTHYTYDKLSDEEQYLTFEAIEDNCEIKIYKQYMSLPLSLEVSKDLVIWTEKTMSAGGSAQKTLGFINTGEKLYVRGNNTTLSEDYNSNHRYTFASTKNVYVYGNVYSLLNATNFSNITTLDNDCRFISLFGNSGLNVRTLIYSHNTHKLVLPATSLTTYCYAHMFDGCTTLERTPLLPAITVPQGAYTYMFDGCTSLNHIECLGINGIENNDRHYKWVRNVASSGTFIKNSSTTNWGGGESGIPTDWTVDDYVEPATPSPIATEDYVDNGLATKANKVDYTIPMDMTTQSLDWSALNAVTSTGMYHCVARVDYMGVQMDMGCYYLSVVGTSNGRILQTLFSVENSSVAQYGETRMSLYSRSSADNGSTWTNVTQLYLPSINDGAVTSAQALETVYSRSKVDSLISALEARIYALEHPNT